MVDRHSGRALLPSAKHGNRVTRGMGGGEPDQAEVQGVGGPCRFGNGPLAPLAWIRRAGEDESRVRVSGLRVSASRLSVLSAASSYFAAR